jgi:hypothetical protein
MYRRQFLQFLKAMGVGSTLPTSVLSDEDPSAALPKIPQLLVSPSNSIKATASGCTISKIGIVAIGRLGSAMLNDVTGQLQNLNRFIAISTKNVPAKPVTAYRKILVGDGILPLDPNGTRQLLWSYRRTTNIVSMCDSN